MTLKFEQLSGSLNWIHCSLNVKEIVNHKIQWNFENEKYAKRSGCLRSLLQLLWFTSAVKTNRSEKGLGKVPAAKNLHNIWKLSKNNCTSAKKGGVGKVQ